MEPSRFTDVERDEIAKIAKETMKETMKEAMTEYFEEKGSVLKRIIIGTAVVVGAITVILGGAKTILGWAGFSYLSSK
jgi:hypothetical protein